MDDGCTHLPSLARAEPHPVTAPSITRLLIVDDSAFNRRHIAEAFATIDEVEIVGNAADGAEALRLAVLLKPDLITLDLEMPRMDGFTFLRMLLSRQPTPVIVVSSYAQQENVFKALELGALDFVTNTDRLAAGAGVDLGRQLVAKVFEYRKSRRELQLPGAVRRLPSGMFSHLTGAVIPQAAAPSPPLRVPQFLVAIASSTGGPAALLDIFAKLRPQSNAAFVMAQHMPDKFTRPFADRLNRRGPIRVTEAQQGDRVGAGTGFVCPGGHCMEATGSISQLQLEVSAPLPSDRYVPCGDRLLASVAACVGARAIGVILTGMGDDGVEGARAIRAAGGIVIAESAETAVVHGMPGAAGRAGVVTHELTLGQIADFLARLA